FDGKPRIAVTGFLPTYTFRVLPASWLSVSYWASVGPYAFELMDENENAGAHNTQVVISLRERLRVAAPFLRMGDGTGFALAASVVHTLVPYGSLGDAPLAGSTFGWLAEFVIDGG